MQQLIKHWRYVRTKKKSDFLVSQRTIFQEKSFHVNKNVRSDRIRFSFPFSFEEGIKLALPIKPSSNNSTTPRSFHSFENLWTGSLSINHSCPRVFAFIHSPFEKLPFAYTLSYWFMNITGRFKKLVPFRGGPSPCTTIIDRDEARASR